MASGAKKFKFISPGVFTREIDQSQLPAEPTAIGPTIFGRTRKGPGLRPIKIESFEQFVNVFGDPDPGAERGDNWRTGNFDGPTYGAYAAKAWLASGQAPVTMMRLLGAQNLNATTAGKAGWETSGEINRNLSENGGAYGLFLISSGAASGGGSELYTNLTGTLAAVWYLEKSSSVVLSGNLRPGSAGAATTTASAGALFLSSGADREFQAIIYKNEDEIEEKVCFNFNQDSDKYIRKVFNTNPSQVNSSIVSTTSNAYKSYWLGETYDQMITRTIASSSQGKVYGIILGLASGSSNAIDWEDRRQSFQNGESPWFYSQDLGLYSNFDLNNASRLFKLVALDYGESTQKEMKVSIEQIRAPEYPEIDPYGSFSVVLRSVRDTDNAPVVIERYDLCNLNPNSADYVAKKIGDKYFQWSGTERRLREYGDYPNQSAFVRVEVDDSVANGGTPAAAIPFGYFGPPRVKGFSFVSGTTYLHAHQLGDVGPLPSTRSKALVVGSSSIANPGGVGYSAGHTVLMPNGAGRFAVVSTAVEPASKAFTGSFIFPAIRLRLSASDGGIDPTDAYFGIQTTKTADSITFDSSYFDMVRSMPAAISTQTFTPGTSTEDSFAFTLDDVIVNTTNSGSYYLSGSRKLQNSYTALNGARKLLELGYDKFTAPMFGGFDGLDITEKEPFRNEGFLNASEQTELNNYGINTLRRSIDTVADPEFVETNLMTIPGVWTPAVTDKLITTCENRADALAIVDVQYAYTPAGTENTSDAVARRPDVTQAISTLRARAINTSYACTFFPWVQVRDANVNRLVDVPPSVAALGTFGTSQARSELWFAPAGFVRGGLSDGGAGIPVTGVKMRLTSKDRDNLYAANINPIATFPSEGIVIFGQKTLQISRSALDRINVRRLMIFIKKEISRISNGILFDPNVQTTWDRFTSAVNPFLADVKARFGLTDFRVILDSTTTTDELIDRNILYAKIYLKPARAIEFIALDFIITRTGASFDD
jgi:hypothetical protein